MLAVLPDSLCAVLTGEHAQQEAEVQSTMMHQTSTAHTHSSLHRLCNTWLAWWRTFCVWQHLEAAATGHIDAFGWLQQFGQLRTTCDSGHNQVLSQCEAGITTAQATTALHAVLSLPELCLSFPLLALDLMCTGPSSLLMCNPLVASRVPKTCRGSYLR